MWHNPELGAYLARRNRLFVRQLETYNDELERLLAERDQRNRLLDRLLTACARLPLTT